MKRGAVETCFWFFVIILLACLYVSVAHSQQLPVVNNNGTPMYSPDKPFEHITLEECDGPGCGSGGGGAVLPFSCLVFGTSSTGGRCGAPGDISALLGYAPVPAVALPSSGLLAWYKFVETSGTALIDYSGSGNNGTITNAPTMNGQGYYFTSQQNNVNLPAALNAANTYYFVLNNPIQPQGSTNEPVVYTAYLSSTDPTGLSLQGLAGDVNGTNFNTGHAYSYMGLDAAEPSNGGNPFLLARDIWASTHVITLVCNSGAPGTFYLDGVPSAAYSDATTSCFNMQTSGNFFFGGMGSSSQYTGTGPVFLTYYGALFYSSSHTAAQVAQIAGILRAQATAQGASFAPPTYYNPGPSYIATGDSITAGAYVTAPQSYPVVATEDVTAAGGTVYTPQNFGVGGEIVQGQIVNAPYLYAPWCQNEYGRSVASLMEGTNNFDEAEWYSGASGAAKIIQLNAGWVSIMKTAGCRTMLIGMISRYGTDGYVGGTPLALDVDKNFLDADFRQSWRAMGADFYVDMGADPHLGADGAYASTTYFADSPTGIHPSVVGQAIMANAVACGIEALDGSTPANPNPVPITGASYTMTCGDGGVIANAASNEIAIDLNSAIWQTGRQIQVCNNTTAGSDTVTVFAPSDFPLDNISGSASLIVANHTCASFTSTFNGNTSAPGDYWQTATAGSGGGGGGGATLTYYQTPGYINTSVAATVNGTVCGGVVIPNNVSAGHIFVDNVGPTAGSDNADVGIYTKAGVLEAHTGAIHLGNLTGFSGGTQAIAAGASYVCFTGVTTTAANLYENNNQPSFYPDASIGVTTSGGVLPSTITPPSDSLTIGGSTIAFILMP